MKIGRTGIKKNITRRIKENLLKDIKQTRKQLSRNIMKTKRIFKEERGGAIIRMEISMLKLTQNITRKIKHQFQRKIKRSTKTRRKVIEFVF